MVQAAKKKPSTVELARREAQAAKDTGENNLQVVEVDWHGHTFTVDQHIIEDTDFVEAQMIVGDELSSEHTRGAATFRAMRTVLGDQYDELKNLIREEHEGKCHPKDLFVAFEEIMEAASPNS